MFFQLPNMRSQSGGEIFSEKALKALYRFGAYIDRSSRNRSAWHYKGVVVADSEYPCNALNRVIKKLDDTLENREMLEEVRNDMVDAKIDYVRQYG